MTDLVGWHLTVHQLHYLHHRTLHHISGMMSLIPLAFTFAGGSETQQVEARCPMTEVAVGDLTLFTNTPPAPKICHNLS